MTLPDGYVLDDLPNPVSVDVGFANYKSEVKATSSGLRYSNEFVVKGLDLAP